MRPTSYERLCAARAVRPLCWHQEKPHLFLHEGIWRVSLVPMKRVRRTSQADKEKGREIARRWTAAYGWLSVMKQEGRLP